MQMKHPRVEEAHLGPRKITRVNSKRLTLSTTIRTNLVAFLLQKILQNLLVRGLDRTHCLKGEMNVIQNDDFSRIFGKHGSFNFNLGGIGASIPKWTSVFLNCPKEKSIIGKISENTTNKKIRDYNPYQLTLLLPKPLRDRRLMDWIGGKTGRT